MEFHPTNLYTLIMDRKEIRSLTRLVEALTDKSFEIKVTLPQDYAFCSAPFVVAIYLSMMTDFHMKLHSIKARASPWGSSQTQLIQLQALQILQQICRRLEVTQLVIWGLEIQ